MNFSIDTAVDALKQGLLVAFPTETVYGLGADATSETALSRLYQVKGRPPEHPVIVHLHSPEQMIDWARAVPAEAWLLAETFWPGPMTLIFRRQPHVSDWVTGGQNTIGLRIPRHPVALELLQRFGNGIAAPSANRFGRISATTAEDVHRDLGKDVAVILNGGPCDIGIESTIIDLSGPFPRVLRPGMILEEQILALLNLSGPNREANLATTIFDNQNSHQTDNIPRAPGMLSSHYAPRTPITLVTSEQLLSSLKNYANNNNKCAVLSFLPVCEPTILWLQATSSAEEYARYLYSNLHRLDMAGADVILIESPPRGEKWESIWDRLSRAAAPRI